MREVIAGTRHIHHAEPMLRCVFLEKKLRAVLRYHGTSKPPWMSVQPKLMRALTAGVQAWFGLKGLQGEGGLVSTRFLCESLQ